MKKKYLIYLLTLLMVLSPVATFADAEAGDASEGEVSAEALLDAAPAPEAPAAEAAVTAEEAAAPEAPAAIEEEPSGSTETATEETAQPQEPQYPAKGNDECFWVDGSGRGKAQDKDGIPVKGLFKAQRVAGKLGLYYADESGNVIKQEGPVTVSKGNLFVYTMIDGETGWNTTGGTSYTYLIKNHDGDYYVTNVLEGLETAGGKTYYVKGGIVQTTAGIIEFEGAKYYVQEGGEVLMNAGFTPDKKHFIPSADGKILTTEGKFNYNGKLYYAGAGGEIPSEAGLYGTGDIYFYVNADGTVKTDAGFITFEGKKYLVKDGGEISKVAGAIKFGGNYYVAESGGAIVTQKGFVEADGNKYYVSNSEGVLKAGKAFKVNGKKYHAKSNGVIAVGVHKWEGVYYYSGKSGGLRSKTGVVKWNGNYYHVNKNGKVTLNKKVKYNKKYYIAGKKGKIYRGIFTWKKNMYYANSKGVLRTKAGLFKYDGDRYYSKSGGKLYRNTLFSAGGNKYLAEKDGKIKIGYYKWNGSYYLTNDKGAVYTKEGKYTYNKNEYFVKSGGALASYEFVTFGKDSSGNDIHYFVNTDGSIAKKSFTYKGVKITPNSKTGKISLEDYWEVFPNEKPEEEDDNN